MVFGQTTCQSLSNFEPLKPQKYKQLWRLGPGLISLKKAILLFPVLNNFDLDHFVSSDFGFLIICYIILFIPQICKRCHIMIFFLGKDLIRNKTAVSTDINNQTSVNYFLGRYIFADPCVWIAKCYNYFYSVEKKNFWRFLRLLARYNALKFALY